MTNAWKSTVKKFNEDENGRPDVSTENISRHSRLQQRQKKTNTKLLGTIKKQTEGRPYRNDTGSYNTGHTESSAMHFVA